LTKKKVWKKGKNEVGGAKGEKREQIRAIGTPWF
jgi:hypothetical protein